eukprot:scaffold207694_cov24-Tisochrysis_lutea.AAC.1
MVQCGALQGSHVAPRLPAPATVEGTFTSVITYALAHSDGAMRRMTGCTRGATPARPRHRKGTLIVSLCACAHRAMCLLVYLTLCCPACCCGNESAFTVGQHVSAHCGVCLSTIRHQRVQCCPACCCHDGSSFLSIRNRPTPSMRRDMLSSSVSLLMDRVGQIRIDMPHISASWQGKCNIYGIGQPYSWRVRVLPTHTLCRLLAYV